MLGLSKSAPDSWKRGKARSCRLKTAQRRRRKHWQSGEIRPGVSTPKRPYASAAIGLIVRRVAIEGFLFQRALRAGLANAAALAAIVFDWRSPFAHLGLPTPGIFLAPADGVVAVLHFIIPALRGRTLRLFCTGGRSCFCRSCFCCLLGFRSRSFLGHC